MSLARRALDLRLHDAKFGIWQDDANDPSFQRDIFGGLIRFLRSRGWSVGVDRDVRRRFASLSPMHRSCIKGPLRAALSVHGRVVELEVWSTDYEKINRNGHRYGFDILQRMPFLTQMRVRLLARQVEAWLSERSTLTVSRSAGWEATKTPAERIAAFWVTSGHADKALGRTVCRDPRNARSADGRSLEHGAKVWYADDRGRICRGVAFYSLNSQWYVIGGGRLLCESCFDLYAEQPADLRKRRNKRRRRERLERLLAGAIRAMNFERAAVLRDILFGPQPIYRIWSTKNDCYYATNYAGYSRDSVTAGAYTFEEARAEVLRVPHHLQLETPAGARLAAAEIAVAAHG